MAGPSLIAPVDPPARPSHRHEPAARVPWRVDVARFRCLLLGTLGVAVSACGGLTGDAPTVRDPNASPFDCAGPVEDIGGGWERCSNGIVHRPRFGECPSVLPPPPPGIEPGSQGCIVDSHCDEGEVCFCDPPIGVCIPAQCTSDADCGELACTTFNPLPGCGSVAVSCQTLDDTCVTDADCGSEQWCSDDGNAASRSCMGQTCYVGRPFLVDGRQRLAAPAERADWYPDASSGPELPAAFGPPDMDSALSAAVSQGWLERALMEHASVAAFARFALQLSALGAPADLIDASAAAMRDEIRHARACFDLARRYAARDLGPGPLRLDGACDAWSIEEVLLATILEGCIGETVAALEAAEAAGACEDPAVRAVLAEIERDETQHARLAWRFASWALARFPTLRAAARRTFQAELDSVASASASSPLDAALLRHGLMPSSLRGPLRERVLREVIEPCSRALLGSASVATQRAAEAGAHA